ncbi:MAG: purine-binding chemotaxis protein CheW [Polyangiaceae bacterium]|nr:purine-binding chemotaxis protein CheW [Polyangiaceae bacterium]
MKRQAARFGRRASKARGELKNLVRFRLGETYYAFDVANVEEVVQPASVTELPQMASSVSGVFDHRGRVTPIVDLRPRLGLSGTEPSRQTKWILMRTEFGLVGFAVDRVLDVIGTSDVLDAPPPVGPNAHERAIRGVVHIESELVFVLDEGRLASVVASMTLPDELS